MSILNKYSNRPKLYFTLPSKNYFYNFSKEQLSILNEVGVMPLSIIHQLSVKNPEKLFNGAAIEEIISDCTTIREMSARDLLKCDVDYLLLGIKIATDGEIEEVECECPKCNSTQTHRINLESLMTGAKVHTKNHFVDINVGLSDDRQREEYVRVYIRPATFGESLSLEQEVFEDNKAISNIYNTLQNLPEDEVTEEVEQEIYSKVNSILSSLTVDSMKIFSNSIIRIVVLDSELNETVEQETDKEEIYKFVTALGKKEYIKLKDKMKEVNSYGINPVIKMKCEDENCGEEWDYIQQINISDFFGKDS